MRRFPMAMAMALSAVTVGAPAVVSAQTISARSADLRIGGRLHNQYVVSSEDGANSNFFTRRARLIVGRRVLGQQRTRAGHAERDAD